MTCESMLIKSCDEVTYATFPLPFYVSIALVSAGVFGHDVKLECCLV